MPCFHPITPKLQRYPGLSVPHGCSVDGTMCVCYGPSGVTMQDDPAVVSNCQQTISQVWLQAPVLPAENEMSKSISAHTHRLTHTALSPIVTLLFSYGGTLLPWP